MSDTKRSIPLFIFNIVMSSLAVGIGVWLTVWSFLPPPQPSTRLQRYYTDHQNRLPGPLVFGSFTALWALCEAVQLLLAVLQIITWRNPLSRSTMWLERLVWVRIPVIVGLLLALRLASGIFCMASVLPNVKDPYSTQAFDPDKKVAYGVGWGVSMVIHFVALLANTLWMKHFRKASLHFNSKEQADIAMQENEDARRADERLAALRSQHAL